ncbi:hypothetical protein FR483_n285R [Paramecium bursaria Chlorella virus FR483]|uniref:Uncharacterized protein n285R n=1 Tax=Paramecium bursaria Chlorella virus FR483 TaxID=399781 RepID=A7J6Y9_PBCVF|nr:hypothetical protein FR483_n285R [Paramecium bursaria Chlorella virus FR483]ABT15570.1 hypothetical protein FR483_n285R [Paramecium bursaria Chlorella virus FR483]
MSTSSMTSVRACARRCVLARSWWTFGTLSLPSTLSSKTRCLMRLVPRCPLPTCAGRSSIRLPMVSTCARLIMLQRMMKPVWTLRLLPHHLLLPRVLLSWSTTARKM